VRWSRAVVACVATVTIAVLPNTAAAATPDQAGLMNAARQSLLDESAVLEGRTVTTLVPGVGEFGLARTAAERLAAAINRRDLNASYGLRFLSTDVALVFDRISWTGTTAMLRAHESTERHFVTNAHDPDPSRDVMKQWATHVFTFQSISGVWKLTYDAVEHAVYRSNPAEAVDSVGSHTTVRGGPRTAMRFGLASPLSGGTYNAAGAAFHAYQFAYSTDPNYRSWPSDDCTNFVSQALRAGDWQYRQDGSWDWFYSPTGQSQSWVNAYSLKQFLNFGGRASFLSYFEDLQAGDVLTADWGYNGPGVDHQMIVDARDGGYLSGIYVTYHSVNTYHRPLSDLLAANPTSSNTYWAWHITGIY
jgi:hypothetical protein